MIIGASQLTNTQQTNDMKCHKNTSREKERVETLWSYRFQLEHLTPPFTSLCTLDMLVTLEGAELKFIKSSYLS